MTSTDHTLIETARLLTAEFDATVRVCCVVAVAPDGEVQLLYPLMKEVNFVDVAGAFFQDADDSDIPWDDLEDIATTVLSDLEDRI